MIVAHFHKKLWSAKGDMNLVAKLSIESGAFVTLYGPSGAGKTSILRMLAGLMTPDTGNISAFGETWFDDEKKLNLAPQKRSVGFLFQDYALFPNMTIRQNLEYAMTKGQSNSVMEELMDIMDLSNMADRKPGMLSGGQQQRVALARALVAQPQILLLDEPLSALDTDMRLRLQAYILKAHQQFGLTTLMVSHDVGEVLKMSDQVVVLEEGQITEQGTPADVFAKNDISGKFQFTGEVIQISRQDVVFVITVLIGKELVKVIADESDTTDLAIGDKVLVASKAFNPIIQKI